MPLLPSKELPSVHTRAAPRHLSHCGSAARSMDMWLFGVRQWCSQMPPRSGSKTNKSTRGSQISQQEWQDSLRHPLCFARASSHCWDGGIFEICCLHSYCSSSQTHIPTLAQAGSFKMGRLLQFSLHWTIWRTVGSSSKVVEFTPVACQGCVCYSLIFFPFKISF